MSNEILRLHCPNCRKNIRDDDTFCPNCGINLDAPLENEELDALVNQCLEKAEKALESGKKLKEALASCDQAIEFSPESAEAHNMRGLILDAMGKTDESILAYQEAVRLNPDFTEAFENLTAAKKVLPIPTQDERIMAALTHASILLPTIGVIAPIIIWVTQKEKSQYVAFQSLQALAFQICMTVAWVVGMGCYGLSFVGMFLTVSFASSSGSSQNAAPILGFGFLVPILIFGTILISGFLFTVYGAFGAIKAFQGKAFRYALIGKWVENFMQPKKDVVTNQ